jgi:hypothetical protein
MMDHTAFLDAEEFAKHLRRLHGLRRRGMLKRRKERPRRIVLSSRARNDILSKTGSRCHLCGGRIDSDETWSADHVLAHAHGGANSANNYLPAHALCNSYRWHFGSEEFQWILKLGVWLRSRIAEDDREALDLADRFVRYERARQKRRVVP